MKLLDRVTTVDELGRRPLELRFTRRFRTKINYLSRHGRINRPRRNNVNINRHFFPFCGQAFSETHQPGFGAGVSAKVRSRFRSSTPRKQNDLSSANDTWTHQKVIEAPNDKESTFQVCTDSGCPF